SLHLTLENERTLLAHSWPGNVRELANALERAVVLAEGGRIHLELDGGVQRGTGAVVPDESVRGHRRVAEREAILAALELCSWNRTLAASRLGISRRCLLYEVKSHGIEKGRAMP